MEFGISNLPQSPDTGQNSDGSISNFRISDKSFIDKNYHNSRTSHDTDLKLGPVTKVDKRNMARSKKLYDDNISANYGVIVFFQFMANLKPSRNRILEVWSIKYKFLLKVTFHLTKSENRTKKSLTHFSYYCFEYRYLFLAKIC